MRRKVGNYSTWYFKICSFLRSSNCERKICSHSAFFCALATYSTFETIQYQSHKHVNSMKFSFINNLTQAQTHNRTINLNQTQWKCEI